MTREEYRKIHNQHSNTRPSNNQQSNSQQSLFANFDTSDFKRLGKKALQLFLKFYHIAKHGIGKFLGTYEIDPRHSDSGEPQRTAHAKKLTTAPKTTKPSTVMTTVQKFIKPFISAQHAHSDKSAPDPRYQIPPKAPRIRFTPQLQKQLNAESHRD